MVTSGQHQEEIWVDKRRSGLPEPDEDDGGMKELVGTFLLPSLCSLPGVSYSLLCYLHRAKIGFHITFHIPMCSLIV